MSHGLFWTAYFRLHDCATALAGPDRRHPRRVDRSNRPRLDCLALSLVFIPYLTLIPYLVFGRSTFDGYIKARRQANEEMRKAISELNWRPWSKKP